MSNLSFTTSITFNAPKEKVWEGIVDEEIVKQYFFDTLQQSDWKVGSPITWSGEWDGKQYQDKGTILEITPGSHLKYNYWSSMGTVEDKPENYLIVTYDLVEDNGVTTLTITQANSKDKAQEEHSETNWQHLFGALKKMLEEK